MRFLVLSLVSLALVGCKQQSDSSAVSDGSKAAPQSAEASSNTSSNSDDVHHYFHKTEKPHAAEWTYDGSTGPSHWGDLIPKYVLAKDGKQQSPIDIAGAQSQDLPKLEITYKPTKIDLVYNGHTVEETEELGSSLAVAGKTFALKQFHFHAPSEHTIDGKHSAMEMHLVHMDDAGRIAVIGVMINEGAQNDAFAPLWNHLPTEKNKESKQSVTIDGTDLLPADQDYYHYMGSLTTPPCTQDVHWYVLTTPIQLSTAQIARFTQIINNNNRPTQPLNDRKIARSRS